MGGGTGTGGDTAACPVPSRPKTVMDNPKACGAPANWPWGYLPCGCCNDGYGKHTDGPTS